LRPRRLITFGITYSCSSRAPAASRKITSLPVAPHGAQPVDNRPFEPNQALTLLVGLVLIADAAEREGPRYRLERLDADRNADHARG
jgi:hypothetical protein